MKIATVDYSDFISGDAEKRNQFIQELGDSFSNIGFAIVKNHGVTKELRDNLYDASVSFFEMDDNTKKKYEIEGIAGQRGYISPGRETAKGADIPDLKEFYHIGQEVPENNEFGYPANIWPEETPQLKKHGLEVFDTFNNTGRDLLRAIALYLNLDENYFDQKIEKGNSILRLLHYFPQTDLKDIPNGAVRAAAHEDINLITLLMGGTAEGLQAKTKAGEWINVSPQPDEIVINVGDMLQRLTNGKLVSTTHRVINPRKELLHTSRYSTPFFLHPI
ncbi:MAG: isopenicillin N synthase family oxygenase, partial [Crocinitomicaceae bacterium]|nr:isopenicillin N synthase family oxygenase [Crocinitomicaceae bacterium]